MEASPTGDSQPQSNLRGRVRLEADIIRRHLQANQPVSPEKALMIYVMQHSIDEWDSRFGLGIAREGEW